MRLSRDLLYTAQLLLLCVGMGFCDHLPAVTPPAIELATTYSGNVNISEYWVSEKLDGIRARWDGQRLISKGGNPFNPPNWFVAGFPAQALDGELWIDRARFEETASIVMRDEAGDKWQKLKFMLFDLPDDNGTFSQRLLKLSAIVTRVDSPYLHLITHYKLADETQLLNKLDDIVTKSGEGLMLHHQNALYSHRRNAHLIKLKTFEDEEAKVISHLPGKGKYQGLMGSIKVELKSGEQFKIGSGFSDLQRQYPPPIGAIVTFKYYGKTARGIPRFASFMRIRSP